jgi:tetratricopeptide (TPR) repeat protein
VSIGILLLLTLFTWQRNGVWKDGVTLWTDAANKAPGSVRAHVNLGIAYSQAGQLDKSETYLLEAIKIDPNDGFTYFNLGTTLEKQKRYQEAIAIYKKAIGLPKVNPALLDYNLSLVYQKLNDYSNSLKHVTQAIARNPLHYGSYVVLGRAYFKTGNYPKAKQTYEEALKLFPDKGDLYVSLAAVYEHMNRLQSALNMLNIGLTKKDINKAQAYNNLGIIYGRLKRLSDSRSAAMKAIELDPELLDAHITLGITYEDMGQQDLAFAEFREAWHKVYDMVATYNYWAVNFMKQNDTDRAVMYLQEALRLEPDHQESKGILEKVLELKK